MSMILEDFDYGIQKRIKELRVTSIANLSYDDLYAVFKYASVNEQKRIRIEHDRLDKLDSDYEYSSRNN